MPGEQHGKTCLSCADRRDGTLCASMHLESLIWACLETRQIPNFGKSPTVMFLHQRKEQKKSDFGPASGRLARLFSSRGTHAGGFVLTRQEAAGKWGKATYSLVRTSKA
jgi:hypothetical protein